MNAITNALVRKLPITEAMVEEYFAEICEQEHSSCNNTCPVHDQRDCIPWTKDLSNCRCFKNGKKMLAYIREHIQ